MRQKFHPEGVYPVFLNFSLIRRFHYLSLSALRLSEVAARKRGWPIVGTEHLLLALSWIDFGEWGELIRILDLASTQVEAELDRMYVGFGAEEIVPDLLLGMSVQMEVKTQITEIPISVISQRVCHFASDFAGTGQSTEVRLEHILLGLREETNGVAFKLFDNLGISHGRIFNAVNDLDKSQNT